MTHNERLKLLEEEEIDMDMDPMNDEEREKLFELVLVILGKLLGPKGKQVIEIIKVLK